MSNPQANLRRELVLSAAAAAVGIGVSLLVGAIAGTGRLGWPWFAGIAVAANLFLTLAIPGTGRHVAENVATSLILVVLAAAWGLMLGDLLVPLVAVAASGGAAGTVANVLCQRGDGRAGVG